MEHIWLNSTFLSSDKVDVESLKSHYSNSGAYENISFYNSKLFQLEKHIERLFYSAKTLFMDTHLSFDNIFEVCKKLIEINQLKNGHINLAISLNKEGNNTNTSIFCTPRTNSYPNDVSNKKPLLLEISPIAKLAMECSSCQSKISNLHATNYISKKNASTKGFDDALILDHRGFITQATSSNFFMVKDGQLYTPPPEFCLNGITRQTIIEIAKNNNIQVIEKFINKEELLKADEVFLTETTDEINSISSINGHNFQDNPITKMLYSKFYQLTQG